MCTVLVFFFQAEDGIRDVAVTGVQTCALPIWSMQPTRDVLEAVIQRAEREADHLDVAGVGRILTELDRLDEEFLQEVRQIGRASCRKECRSRWSPYH